MSENKEYVSRSDELGNIHISEEVLAAIAAAVRGERTSTEPVPAVWMDFAAPGAVHGFMPEDDRAATADNPDGHGLRITLRAATASVATPVAPDTVNASAYRVVGTPKLYPGMTVTLRVEAPASVTATPFSVPRSQG